MFSGFAWLPAGYRSLVVIGFIEPRGQDLHNSAAVLHRGKLIGVYGKSMLLPGETEAFEPGESPTAFEANGPKLGLNICYNLCFTDRTATTQSTVSAAGKPAS